MRIVTYLPGLETSGGVALHVLEVSRELAARGHQINVLYERDGNLTDEFRSFSETITPGPSVVYGDSPLSDLVRIAPRALAAGRLRPDLIYANNMSELAWADGVRLLTRAPVICQFHEFHPFRRVSMRTLGAPVHRFVTVSQFMKDQWSGHGLKPELIDVVPNGFALTTYPRSSADEIVRSRKALGLPANAYVVLYMGRIIPEKGVDVLLKAWARLALSPDDARLLIVGVPSDPDEYVSALQAQAPPGCEWLPNRRDVLSVLHAADVLVLPSIWDEPFGRVIVEAMATGRPAIASAVGGIPEILDGEFESMLFRRGDVSELARRLGDLRWWRLDDPGLEARCVEHVARRFTLDTTVAQLEDVFIAATATRRRAHR